ncbi:MAG: hypothetical protein JW841_14645 [Deltaproteobacteria bacterium]|nr:hypothetical protein [Deltaproteobacteria bacterium]
MSDQQNHGRPRPPPPQARGWLGSFPKLGAQLKVEETKEHADEVREVLSGRNIVELNKATRERQLAVFHSPDMLVVRSWMSRRPIESPQPASAMVAFPRMWTTNRGRYCSFKAPGAGRYGLVRSRPTF